MSSVAVKYSGHETIMCVPEGIILLDALREGGFSGNAPCGGNGKCGKCRVTVTTGRGTETLLACRTVVTENCTVLLEEQWAAEVCEEDACVSVGEHRDAAGYGCAADIGTTTVVVRLISLADGRILGTKSSWNAQRAYGADVISRAQYCMENTGGLARLSALIRAQILDYTDALCRENGVAPDELRALAVAGNTIMEHIFAGLSPAGIAVSPFAPKTLFGDDAQCSLPERSALAVYYAPCLAGYVGGDIMAGLLAAGLDGKQETALFLDVGTNGEMALYAGRQYLCCAVACGPAFEGAEISCGMAGSPGAVSRVTWNGEVLLPEIIGGGAPKGLCGSGLVSLLAALLEAGAVDETGRLLPPEEAPERMRPYLREDDDGNGLFSLVADGDVFLTAGDVRKLQLAKAAVAAGIQMLLCAGNIPAEKVERVYLAGGFGSRLDARSAGVIGMIPPCLAEKTVPLGNTSLAGAQKALLDADARERLLTIREKSRYLELSGNIEFNEMFMNNMMFGETEEED